MHLRDTTGQFRFTPPTHTLVAFNTALQAHVARGGVAAANARFAENQRIISEGLGKLGYKTFVDPKLQVGRTVGGARRAVVVVVHVQRCVCVCVCVWLCVVRVVYRVVVRRGGGRKQIFRV